MEETPLQRLRRQVKHKDGDTRGIARAFMEHWDKDGSGELNRTEFMQGLKSYGVLVGDMTEAEKKALWAEFDKTGDGTVDLHEFLMVLGDVYAYRAQVISEAFNKLDSDRSGEISIFELKGRADVVKFFENAGNADGMISKLQFAAHCSAISSTCETDEEFRAKMEELTDIPPIVLPPWKYLTTNSPQEVVDWVNANHASPYDIFGGCCKGTFHVWCRPAKRSFIKGAYQYDYVYDADFSAEMAFADFKENKQNPTAAGMSALSNKRLLTEPGAAVLLDVDAAGNAHFLRVVAKPKRGARSWAGKLRYICTTSMTDGEAWINQLSPMPATITSCIQHPDIHLFVNDTGPSGYQYKFRRAPEIPFELIAADQCKVLGFNDDGECYYLEIPPHETALTTKKAVVAVANPVRKLIRNDEAFRGNLEGIYDTEEKLRELFDRIDVDNSGYITHAEFQALYAALETFGVGEGHRGFVRNIMARGSMLDDDMLSFDEFCVLMLKIAQW